MTSTSLRVRVLHGPNLNLLGSREPGLYGATSLDEIDDGLVTLGTSVGCEVRSSQHNLEGDLVDAIQEAGADGTHGLILNPAAYTHTSVALRDALLAVGLPAVEVHLTNVYGREPFRHHSFIADVVLARVMGFGAKGYGLALEGLVEHLRMG